jgi:GNAT superfamily N-acetyltransferase
MNQTNHPAFTLRPATPEDAPIILQFIKDLAKYERLPHLVVATEDQLRKTLFGERPVAEIILGFEGDEAAAFALFFHNYSTFLGRAGIYLEDLFVRPEFRRKGYGKIMLSKLAKIAVERECGRLEWSVLDWNQPAIDFYKSLSAKPMEEWTVFRLMGKSLENLANG